MQKCPPRAAFRRSSQQKGQGEFRDTLWKSAPARQSAACLTRITSFIQYASSQKFFARIVNFVDIFSS
jgi:hypothetical protein